MPRDNHCKRSMAFLGENREKGEGLKTEHWKISISGQIREELGIASGKKSKRNRVRTKRPQNHKK